MEIDSLNEKLETLKKNHKENSQTALEYADEIRDLEEILVTSIANGNYF